MLAKLHRYVDADTTLRQRAYFVSGQFLFVTGLIGVFLPVLPTTGFWILAAICFAKSSSRMYQRIVTWPGIGPTIEAFIREGVINRRSKTGALIGMAVGAAIVSVTPMGILPTAVAIAGISGAAIYVASRPEQ